jgi:hypothetical protein
MPRRHYGSVEELRGAVAVAMERLREGLGHGVLVYALHLIKLAYGGPGKILGVISHGGPKETARERLS